MIFSVDLFILANKFTKRCLFFSITISRGTPVEKPWFSMFVYFMKILYYIIFYILCALYLFHFHDESYKLF
jgi:hypothetical protein